MGCWHGAAPARAGPDPLFLQPVRCAQHRGQKGSRGTERETAVMASSEQWSFLLSAHKQRQKAPLIFIWGLQACAAERHGPG